MSSMYSGRASSLEPSLSYAAPHARHQAMREATTNSRWISSCVLLFLAGWITYGLSLFDIGHYSIPLLYLAALPFCLRSSSRSFTFLILPIASSFFSIIVATLAGSDRAHVISQGVLQTLAILFAAGVASIDWPRHFSTFAKMIVALSVPLVAYGGYQMIARAAHLPFAYLRVTNQQEYATGGLQRGWDIPHYTRASSLFVEPSNFGYFCLWPIALGLSMTKGIWRHAALALAFAGILFSQSLSAALGAAIILLAYFITNPVSLKVIRQVALTCVLLALAAAAIEPLMPEAFARFSERIQQAVSLDQRADSGRVDHLPACWAIFKDSPIWGHGLSSLSAAGDNGNDATTVLYALVLMERGLVGTVFFFAPWFYIAIRAYRLPQSDPIRNPALLLTILHLYSFFAFSLAYFLPFWFSLGLTASLVLKTHLRPTRLAFACWSPAGSQV